MLTYAQQLFKDAIRDILIGITCIIKFKCDIYVLSDSLNVKVRWNLFSIHLYIYDKYFITGGISVDKLNTNFIDQTVDEIVSLWTIYDSETKFKLTLVSQVCINCSIIASNTGAESL
jgi:hypothetical protein